VRVPARLHDGGFSEDATLLLSDWLAHAPRDVVAKNLGVAEPDLDGLPDGERYIFRGRVPPVRGAERAAAPEGRRAAPSACG
jgi:oxalate decarboxylase